MSSGAPSSREDPVPGKAAFPLRAAPGAVGGDSARTRTQPGRKAPAGAAPGAIPHEAPPFHAGAPAPAEESGPASGDFPAGGRSEHAPAPPEEPGAAPPPVAVVGPEEGTRAHRHPARGGGLCILGAGGGWHVRDLLRAGAELGVTLHTADFRTLEGSAHTRGGRAVCGGGLALDGCRAVLVRTMPAGTLEQVVFRMDALHALEGAGVRIVNPPRALETAVDKYLSAVRLAAAGLPVPEVSAAERPADALSAFERLGGDVVLKPLFGSEGRGLVRVRSRGEAERLFEDVAERGGVILQQRFVPPGGTDVRIFVARGAALAAMRRTAREGWVTNIAQGGRAQRFEPGADLEALAVRAAEATGALLAGVDITFDEGGAPWILEVNAVPGWRALARVTGVDIAREVILTALASNPLAAEAGT